MRGCGAVPSGAVPQEDCEEPAVSTWGASLLAVGSQRVAPALAGVYQPLGLALREGACVRVCS